MRVLPYFFVLIPTGLILALNVMPRLFPMFQLAHITEGDEFRGWPVTMLSSFTTTGELQLHWSALAINAIAWSLILSSCVTFSRMLRARKIRYSLLDLLVLVVFGSLFVFLNAQPTAFRTTIGRDTPVPIEFAEQGWPHSFWWWNSAPTRSHYSSSISPDLFVGNLLIGFVGALLILSVLSKIREHRHLEPRSNLPE